MTTYTNIPDTDIDTESPLTVALMTALRNNPLAIQEGDPSAPRINGEAIQFDTIHGNRLAPNTILAGKYGPASIAQSDIAASAIGQSQLKTATTSGSITIDGALAPATGVYTLAGGTYSWWTGSSSVTSGHIAYGAGNTASGAIGLKCVSPGTESFYIDERYIQSSPPYDMGDGVILNFTYLLLNSSGLIVGTQTGPTPPWIYNGPTSLTPDGYTRDGLPYQLSKTMPLEFRGMKLSDIPLELYERYISALQSAPIDVIDLTPERKNADMGIIPHPFIGNSLNGLTVVLIDPVSILAEQLALLIESGEPVRDEVLLNNRLVIGNTQLRRAGPPGVQVVPARWRLTR